MTTRRLEYLTLEQVEQFRKNGYLVIPGFLSEDQTMSLLQRSKELLRDFDLKNHPLTEFRTSEDQHVGDDYFLTSGDKIRFFLEEGVVDENGNLTREKEMAVNKVGHALHKLDPAFRRVTLENQKVNAVVRDLQFHHDPLALQSMVIFKQPQIGGEVCEHNDSTFLYTDPPTALGFWMPLEECTPDNGALSFLPGSHLTAPIHKRFVRLPEGGTGFENLMDPAAAAALKPEGKYIMECCKPGDLVLIHGAVLHKSERNLSSKTRYAYTFHMIESAPYARYDEKNWLQPTPEMPFSRVLDVPNPSVIRVGA
ncbi:phytanoyl-CoA dioxygenase [Vararia minispora EC-137]|uniref:Phytanoyl-CoA dioxygenase n=1 Tax=Vararia minispora EC-137 TaxID=1314806 RepID=A0ACB8QZZ9_9AGAM|nr:phytanoyl-CoA dioxygenase [Vararia minispora EC-137]